MNIASRLRSTAKSSKHEVAPRAEPVLHRRFYVLIPFFVLLLFRIALIVPFNQPHIFADEAGYLTNARHFSGRPSLSMFTTTFYHFGYSLVILPSQLSSDPHTQYRGALAINCLLSASLYFLLYRLLRDLFSCDRLAAVVIASCGAIYPPCTFWTTFAMSETLAFLVIPSLFLLLFYAIDRGKSLHLFLFAALSGAAYSIHPRFILLPVLTLGFLFCLAAFRKVSFSAAAVSAGLLLLVCLINSVVSDRLLGAHWTVGTSDQELGRVVLARMREEPLLTARRVVLFFLGQGSYIVMATAGLSVAGATLLLVSARYVLRRTAPNHRLALASAWAGLACFSVMLASVLVSINNERGVSGVALLYGRFDDSFVPMLICFGLLTYVPPLASLPDAATLTAYRRYLSLAVLVSSALLLLAMAGATLDSGVGTNESVALGYLGSLWQPYRFGALVLSAVGLVMIVDLLLSNNFYWGIGAVVFVFSLTTNWALQQRLTDQKWQASRTEAIVKSVSAFGVTAGISFDLASFDPSTLWALQFLLPGQRHEFFNSARGERPTQPFVIADLNWGEKQQGSVSAIASTDWSRTYPVTMLWAAASSSAFSSPSSAHGSGYFVWPSEMPSHTGRILGLSREAAPGDKADFLVFGPYIPLPRGEYVVSVDYDAADARAEPIATWDITLDAEQEVARGEIRVSPSSSAQGLLQTPLKVSSGRGGSVFEFRLKYLGAGRIRVNRLRIDRLS
jgi:hypothetical protein